MRRSLSFYSINVINYYGFNAIGINVSEDLRRHFLFSIRLIRLGKNNVILLLVLSILLAVSGTNVATSVPTYTFCHGLEHFRVHFLFGLDQIFTSIFI